MENNLIRLLDGQSLDELTEELCDFTIEEQNIFAESQGIKPSTSSDFVPVLGKNVTYIVAVVIFNEAEELLLIQEAKEKCAGSWYLPAGRVEKSENLVEAAKREVMEETGLIVKITTLLAVESASGSWFRFVMTGEITGGELKVPSKADQESLQAKWIRDLKEVTLRSNDILSIIELGRQYSKRPRDSTWHKNILPALKPHHKSYLRLVIAVRKKSTPNRVNILVSEKNCYHFPTCEILPARSLHSTLRKFMIELFGCDTPQHRLVGLLSAEYLGQSISQTDGICLTTLVCLKPTIENVSFIGKCSWHELSPETSNRLSLLVVSKNSTFPLHVVR